MALLPAAIRPAAQRLRPGWTRPVLCSCRAASTAVSTSASGSCRIVVAGAAAAESQRHPQAEDIARVVNWAYRGKHKNADVLAWTSERHMLSGARATADEIQSLLLRCCEETGPGSANERLLLALPLQEAEGVILGTVHIQQLAEPNMCELGTFSVDPDLQGGGVGTQLLVAAERCAAETLNAQTMIMHVLDGNHTSNPHHDMNYISERFLVII